MDTNKLIIDFDNWIGYTTIYLTEYEYNELLYHLDGILNNRECYIFVYPKYIDMIKDFLNYINVYYVFDTLLTLNEKDNVGFRYMSLKELRTNKLQKNKKKI